MHVQLRRDLAIQHSVSLNYAEPQNDSSTTAIPAFFNRPKVTHWF